MISEERSGHVSKQALGFPVGLLLRSPKRRLAKLGRKASNGSVQSSKSDGGVRSAESAGVRQPAKSKIRRHNNRLSTAFRNSPDPRAADDPAELSSQLSVPGILKVFGSDVCQGTHYKSVLATTQSSAKELVREALERYCLEKEDSNDYVLCDVIGQTGADNQWKRECFRVVGDHERPLMLQSLWKPKEGFCRRFEIQRRSTVEQQSLQDRDTITAGVNAQARKLQRNRSRVTSLLVDSGEEVDGLGFWRSLSEMDLSAMGREAGRAGRSTVREEAEPEAHTEKEDTESSDDNTTQYSIHPPFDFPYFLLLQGYNHRQDFILYPMSGTSTVFGRCREHCSGEDEERLKVDVLLFAPDVLPRHCCVRRVDSDAHASSGKRGPPLTTLRPLHGAAVTRNGSPLEEEVQLSPGDLVGLGKHYLLVFKDPTCASGASPSPAWMSRLCPGSAPYTCCSSCGSSVVAKTFRRKPPAPYGRDPEGAAAWLSYEPEQEESVLQEILDMAERDENEAKLSAAFLLILCVRRSAFRFQLAELRQLLLRIAAQIQRLTWDKTKQLAALQPETSSGGGGGGGGGALSVEELIPGLQPLLLWMANCIELLHFVQQDVPQLLAWRRDGPDEDLLEAEMASTRAACEEAMTVLEEVIMFTFQQSVYYLTKSMYSALSGLLDGNPFTAEGGLRAPGGVSGVLEVLKEALTLLTALQVHPDISLQLCAYLFFFINASLFNTLMERGSEAGFYQWSRGVQIRANLDLLMDWVQNIGLGDVAAQFFQKLSAAVNLLAMPRDTLLQASWASLRAEFSALNAAQLHHMLREYGDGKPCPSGWSPSADDAEDVVRTADILESFDSHPPLILPSSSFQLELGKPVLEPALFRQLHRLQDFIARLPGDGTRPGAEEQVSDATSGGARPGPGADPVPARSRGSGGVLAQKLRNLQLQSAPPGAALLTPPNTPQGPEPEAGLREGARQLDTACSADADREEVFTVELQRAPRGLGLALVDGTKTPLRMSGVYVKSLVPDSPAARCQRLQTGDRILAVNGVSLVGMDYSAGRELIRSSGDTLRLLVAKMETACSSKAAT